MGADQNLAANEREWIGILVLICHSEQGGESALVFDPEAEAEQIPHRSASAKPQREGFGMARSALNTMDSPTEPVMAVLHLAALLYVLKLRTLRSE
jgi:hypothetical protein